ncbi:BQ2448_4718 [Microbotryum intermedium]|uniref:BQ2448_4718 protein n=1 Tax=Microbotryum intermedium TaxID=269621 RepID=A0A238FJG4_9BASI|nr:BQ2448_4718 [Microbotryum intermedium]
MTDLYAHHLTQAIQTTFAYERQDETRVYKGKVEHFLIGNAPHGGYIISLCTNATQQHQASTTHRDPAHLTAQFFSPCQPGAVQVGVKTLSVSKRWTRLDASLMQYSKTNDVSSTPVERVRLTYLYTDLPHPAGWGSEPKDDNLSLLPWSKSPFARPTPLLQHPSELKEAPMYPSFHFKDVVKWSELVPIGPEDSPNPSSAPFQKMHSAFYWSQVHEEDDVTQNVALVSFFADMFMNGPELIAAPGVGRKYWFPTMTLSLDFKAKVHLCRTGGNCFPLAGVPGGPSGASPSKSTVGIYFATKSISEGQHDQTVEVWTSPGGIGEGDASLGGPEWRKEAQLLAVSTQLALVIPYSVNEKIANRKDDKSSKL